MGVGREDPGKPVRRRGQKSSGDAMIFMPREFREKYRNPPKHEEAWLRRTQCISHAERVAFLSLPPALPFPCSTKSFSVITTK